MPNVKTTVCYMAVQVVERASDGRLVKWYDGDQRVTFSIAKTDRDDLATQFPGTPYVVIERTIREIGAEVKK